MHKDIRKLTKKLRKQGWQIEEARKHIKCWAPDGETMVTIPSTPSDHRAIKNAKAQLRRSGARDL